MEARVGIALLIGLFDFKNTNVYGLVNHYQPLFLTTLSELFIDSFIDSLPKLLLEGTWLAGLKAQKGSCP